MNVGNVEGAIRLKDEFSEVIAKAIKQLDAASTKIDKSLGNVAKSMTQVHAAAVKSAAGTKQYTAAGAQLKSTLDAQIRQLTGLSAAYSQGGGAVERYLQQLRIEQAQLRANVSASSQQGQAIARRIIEVDRLTLSIKKQQQAEREAAAAAREAAAAAAAAPKGPQRYTAAGKQLSQDLDAENAAMRRMLEAYKQGAKAVAEYNTQQRVAAELARANVQASSLQGRAIADRVRDNERLKASIKQANAELHRASKGAGAFGASLLNLRSLIYGIGLGTLASQLIQAQRSFDQMRFSLAVVVPSARDVGKELAFVRMQASTLGLDFQSAGKSFAWLAAAARDTGVDMKTVRQMFQGVSTAATALGLSSDTASGAFNAMVQMMTKGTVQAEELRGQLGDRIPGAIQMAARAMNMTTVELNDMLKKGDVLATELLPKLAAEMQRVYGPAAQQAASSLNAEMNRLSTAVFDMFLALSKGLNLTDMVRGVGELTTAFNGLVKTDAVQSFFRQISEYLTTIISTFGTVIEMLSEADRIMSKASITVGGSEGLTANLKDAYDAWYRFSPMGLFGLRDGLKDINDWWKSIGTEAERAGRAEAEAAKRLEAAYRVGRHGPHAGPQFDQQELNRINSKAKKILDKMVEDFQREAPFLKLQESLELEAQALVDAANAFTHLDVNAREHAIDLASVENELRREAINLQMDEVGALRPLYLAKVEAARLLEGSKSIDALNREHAEVVALNAARAKSIPMLNSMTKKLALEEKVRLEVARAAASQREEIEKTIRDIAKAEDALADQNISEEWKIEEKQLNALIAAYEQGPIAVAELTAAQEHANKVRELTNQLAEEQRIKFADLIETIVTGAETVEKLDIGAKLDEEIRQMEKALAIRTTSFHSIRGLEQAQRALNIQLDYERTILQSKVVLSEQEKKDIRDKIARTYELAQAMEDASDDAVTLSQKMFGFAEGLDDAFSDASDNIKEIASGVGGLIRGFAQLLDAGKDFTKQMGAWASMAQGLQSVLEGMGAFQTGRGGGFGGSSEGNYAAEGQQIGAIIGGIIGAMVGAPQAGMAIGAAAGGILGGFIKKGADEALAKLTFDFTGFNTNITKAEGQLRGAMEDLGNGIASAVLDVVAAIGGTIVGLPEVSMKIRDGVIGVVIGGVKRKFEEMDDAISFAVSELIKQGDILGLDKMLLDAIRGSGAPNVEALASDIENVLKVMNFGLTDSQIAISGFTSELDSLSQKMVRLLGSSDQLGRALANIAIEEGRRWQQLRDQITGHQKSNAELLKEKQQDALMFNAERALRIADLKMQKMSLEAQAETLRAKAQIANEELHLDQETLQREAMILGKRLEVEEQWLQGLALITEKIAALANLIDIIGSIPDINLGEIRLPGGAGGGSTGPSPAEQAADDLAALMEQLAATARDLLPQWESALANLNFQMQQQITLAHGGAEALRIINEQYAQQLDLLVQQAEASLGLPWLEMVSRLNEFADTMRFLEEQARSAQETLGDTVQVVQDLSPEMRHFMEVLGMVRESISSQMMGLVADIYEAMGYETEAGELRAKIAKAEFAMKVAELRYMYNFYNALGLIMEGVESIIKDVLGLLEDPENWPDFSMPAPPRPERPPRPDPVEDERDELLERLIASIEDLKNTLDNYRDFLTSLERGPLSGATLRNQFISAQSDFQEMLARARGGDMDAIRELPGMAEEFLQLAGQYMDPSSAAYQQLLAMVRGSMSGIAGGIETIIDAAPESALGSNGVLDTIAEILAAMASRWGVRPGWHPGAAILPGPGGPPMPWGRNDTGGISGQASFNNSLFNSLFGRPLRVQSDQLDDIAEELKLQRREIVALRSSTDNQTETMKRADFAQPTLSNRGGGGSKPKASATGA